VRQRQVTQDIGNNPAPSIDNLASQIVEGVVTQLPSLLDLFGVKPRRLPRPTAKAKLELKVELKTLLSGFIQLSELQTSSATGTPKDELERLEKASRIVGEILGFPKNVYVAEYYTRYVKQTINAPTQWDYIGKAGYARHRDVLGNIANSLQGTGHLTQANQLVNTFDNSPDGFVSLQLTASRLPRHLVYLRMRRTKFERKQLDKLLQIYSELAGLYEKLIRLVVGLIEIGEGKEVNYQHLSKRSLNSNFLELKARYPDLTSGFNITIRNAISHSSFFVQYSRGTILFMDNQAKTESSFGHFLVQCRELSALVLAIAFTKGHLAYYEWKGRLEYYESVKSKAAGDG
jgi:hypothetical protein